MTTAREIEIVMPDGVQMLFEKVGALATASGAFSAVDVVEGAVVCRFGDEDVDAEFRLDWDGAGFAVSMMTPDRWLSQSVEATLMNSGDSLEDLIDEEMVELGCDAGPLSMKHFRDEKKRYVFVSPVPISVGDAGTDESAATGLACVRGYERAFAELGDFVAGDD